MCVRAQGVFDHRMKTWQKWQDSQLLLQRKREAEAKLQFTNKPDKLQQAKDEIKEVRRQRANGRRLWSSGCCFVQRGGWSAIPESFPGKRA